MEAELFAFKNCSNLTNEQITTIAFARGITAVVCCVLLLIVLVTLAILASLYPQKVHGTVVKRLAIGLTAAADHWECSRTESLSQLSHGG